MDYSLDNIPVLIEVHASHGGGVPGEHFETLARLGVPYAQRAVRGSTDDQIADHLRGPHATRVSHQRTKALEYA